MKPPQTGGQRSPLSLILPVLLILFMAVILIRTGWVSDDAYITMRTVDNFVHGLGPRWNAAERVQSFTHPLWMFLLSAVYFFTREAYFTCLVLGILLSIVTAVLVAFRLARSTGSAALVLLILVLSKAFVDFSTSGLENPLSHLLLALLMVVFVKNQIDNRRLFQVSLLTALIALNRLDLIVIAAPLLVVAWRETGWRAGWRAVMVGMLPLILWEIFSVIYYGVPFPNTAYAKLETGLTPGQMIVQGGWYFLQSLRIDPLTLTLVIAGLVLGFIRRDRGDIPAAIGILLYLIYVAKIGGDFMGGRFFAAPLLMSAILIARFDFTRPLGRRLVPVLFAATIILGMFGARFGLLTGASFGPGMDRIQLHESFSGVADERAYYYPATGLLKYASEPYWPRSAWVQTGKEYRSTDRRIVFAASVGFVGYFAGPGVYVYDPLALSDPLLSHLPVVRYRWRVGHGWRMAPLGYIESLRDDTNVVADSSLREYYAVIRSLTRGPIFDLNRFRHIIAFNLGSYDHQVDEYLNRSPERIPFDSVKLLSEEGMARPSQLTHLSQGGAIIYSASRLFGKSLAMLVDTDTDYELLAYRDNQIVGADTLLSMERTMKGRIWRTNLSEEVTREGLDSVFVRPLYGKGNYRVGGVQVLP